MFKGDMNKKRAKALQKVKEAITLHGGQTILSTGITGDDARWRKPCVRLALSFWSRTTLRWRWRVDTKA